MTNIEVIIDRCTGCGICVDVCPEDVLEMRRNLVGTSFPNRCVSCGHCGAVCPVDAILSSETNTRSPFTLNEVSDSLPPELALFHNKRSIRRFTPDKLTNKTIISLVQYGERAPSSHNFRQRGYVVVNDPDKIREMEVIVAKVYRFLVLILKPAILKLISLFSKPIAQEMRDLILAFKVLVRKNDAGDSHVFRGAPCVILFTAPKNYDQSRDDCIAAQHYMMLYAHTQGIGSCVIGYAQYAHKKLEKYLRIPRDKRIFAVSVFGYPQHKYKKTIQSRDPLIIWK